MIRSARILGSRWKIKYCDNLLSEADAYGLCVYPQETLKIQSGLPLQLTRQSIIHEITHVIWKGAGLGNSAKMEVAVEALSNGWAAVLAENPRLARYLSTGE